jgi:hypothetical protein
MNKFRNGVNMAAAFEEPRNLKNQGRRKMPNRALFLAVASCFAITGCPDKTEPPKPKTTTTVAAVAAPKPPEAPMAPAASSGQDAKAGATQVAQAAAATTPPGLVGCRPGQCKVSISVANCVITPTPMDLPVARNNQGDDIKWSIAGNDYVFTDNGITFKTGPGTQFSANAGGNSNNYKWRDANTDNNVYAYSIEVKNRTTGAVCPKLDPTVMNGAAAS